MSDGLFANRSPAATSDTDAERTPGQASSRPFAMAGPEAVRMLLGLQRAAGNASVVQLLQRRATPTALRVPVGGASGFPTAPEPGTMGAPEEEIDERQKASEARASEAPAEGGEPVEPELPVDDPDREHSAAERAAKEAEGEGVSITDEFVPLEGGSPPRAEGAGGGGGFVDEGLRGSVPFADADAADLDPGSDDVPHAFVTEKAGSIPYSGGGHGGGPHVMQDVGEIEEEKPPEYDTDWGGPISKASAWVIPGTGTLTVRRSYETSPAGDQGTGWWVSPGAAAALNAHELEHVKASKDLWDTHLQPVLDRVAKSRKLGEKVDWSSSTAEAFLRKTIDWEKGVSEFKSLDGDNKGGGTVDKSEQAKPGYEQMVRYRESGDPDKPKVPVFGGTVDDQFFEHLLVAPGEDIPNLLPLEDEPGALEHHAADDACPTCRALNGTRFAPGSAPPLPVPGCDRPVPDTDRTECRCGYLPAAL
jgi:hypothetical protein